jgi:hypothetical protein
MNQFLDFRTQDFGLGLPSKIYIIFVPHSPKQAQSGTSGFPEDDAALNSVDTQVPVDLWTMPL